MKELFITLPYKGKHELIVCKGKVFDRNTRIELTGTNVAKKAIEYLENRLDTIQTFIDDIDPIWGDQSMIDDLEREYTKICSALF